MPLSDNNLYEFGNFRIDLSERALWFMGEPVALAPKVAETLCLLVENQGRLMTKTNLMDEIWADIFVEKKNQWKQIFIPPEDGGKPEIPGFLSARLHSVRWNVEGTGIYFLSTSETVTNIEFYSLADKSIRRITNFDSQQIHDFSISPDGRTIAVGRGEKTSNIYKISGF